MAKVLQKLRTSGEEWASKLLKQHASEEKLAKPSAETSLLIKTRLGLTRRRYNGFRKHTKSVVGKNALVPWIEAMQHRDAIIPKMSVPVWENDILVCRVTLRDMVSNIITRLMCLEEVQDKMSSFSGYIDCIIHMAAGVDSATGFSQYNQDRNLAKDNSLLTECVLPLILETDTGCKLWVNPNPQSDKFCRAKSMSWQKETDSVTKEIFLSFYEEVDQIAQQPIVIENQVKIMLVVIEYQYLNKVY